MSQSQINCPNSNSCPWKKPNPDYKVTCAKRVLGCTGPHCWGFTSCLSGPCPSSTIGAFCIFDGASDNYNVCLCGPSTAVTLVSNCTAAIARLTTTAPAPTTAIAIESDTSAIAISTTAAANTTAPCGYYILASAQAPIECPAGSYCSANAAAPTPCAPGYACPPLSCTPWLCPCGHKCPLGASAPTPCAPPFYCPLPGAANQTLCPVGYHGASLAAINYF
jgi:hypothetical protein